MKRIVLLAALAVSFNVYAVTFEKGNQMGGQIVLTDRVVASCKNGMKQAYSTSDKGEVMFGCWSIIDDRVWLMLGEIIRVHDPDSFTIKNQPKSTKPTGM